MPGGINRGIPCCNDDINLGEDQIGREVWQERGPHRRMACLDDNVLSLRVAQLAQPLPKRLEMGRGPDDRGAEPEHPDAGDSPWRLRLGGMRHREESESKSDDDPNRGEPHSALRAAARSIAWRHSLALPFRSTPAGVCPHLALATHAVAAPAMVIS